MNLKKRIFPVIALTALVVIMLTAVYFSNFYNANAGSNNSGNSESALDINALAYRGPALENVLSPEGGG